jgi:putative transposase
LAAHSKKAKELNAHLVLIDETGLFLQPVVRRTWSPVGQTPVLVADGGHRKKVSVIGGVSVSPGRQRLGFYFATEPDGFYTVDKVIEYLQELLKHLRGKVIVVWDRGSNHKGPEMRAYLAKQRRLHLEALPAWAPDHNPAEPIWSWLKWGELSNFTPEGLEDLNDEIIERLVDLHNDARLLKALWHRCELPFPE